ncbi:MAG TPA: hypothetical protein VGL93_04085 [Streptosporangiaceae bacterium]|jgi:hypothetical protein
MTSADLLARFADPAPEFGPLPLWWWSGAPVDRARLRTQMGRLADQGVRQAVVMCLAPAGPMFGAVADDPPFLSPQWLDLVDGACADARELGFRLWMYDQIGFSGANFQGALTAARPEFAGLALRRDPSGAIETQVSGFDYFGTEACAALIDRVHGELDRALGRWFGTVIPGFFQDELPAMPTWGRGFAETFAEAYGYDLLPVRAALFGGENDAAARVRRDYHAHRARLARRAFFDPLERWLTSRGLVCGFDQRSPAREGDPVGGVAVYGDYLGTHAGYRAPGSDHWGDPKVHSSLAHTRGHPRTWIEAFHSSGWGGTLEETYDWLAPFLRRGATLYDPHAVYYATVGGWWEWAPPSTCWRQPYWPSYHRFAGAVARLCAVLTAGTHVCDVALVTPTETAQAYVTLDGPLPPASRAAACFQELNGMGSWLDERRGVLDRAGIDHDVLDEATVASGVVRDGALRVGDEAYRTVVLPELTTLPPETAARLRELSRAGGAVVCVGRVPEGVEAGAVRVRGPEDVPPLVAEGPVRVRADVPVLVRRSGGAYVVLLTAHDERSGTRAPIVRLGEGWHEAGLDWNAYWDRLRAGGYTFVPPADRTARVEVTGIPRPRAQRWDPSTGRRSELAVRPAAGGSWVVDVPFADGAMELLVLGEGLPDATYVPPGPVTGEVAVDGPWRAAARSTLDNEHGDLAARERTGVLPVEVWRMEHRTDAGEWRAVTAGFGAFAEAREPDGTWRAAEWSPARGIAHDPAHADTLGPKGHVPEEFLDWRYVAAGGEVAVRTHLPVPEPGLHLAVGAGAARRVVVDGRELPAEGDGYQTSTPLPEDCAGRTVPVEIAFTADRDGPLRASFALVRDPGAYRRPEWLAGDELTRTFTLAAVPEDAWAQVAGDGACRVRLNGTELGRQGDFNPYPGMREIRVHRYDLTPALRTGPNTLTLLLGPDGAAAVDSALPDLLTGPAWTGTPVRTGHRRDPRFVCARPRPHPLPGAHWLEPAAAQGTTVAPAIPDTAPGPPRTERLRFAAPLGATDLRIPTDLDVTVHVTGPAPGTYRLDGGRVRFPGPLPAGAGVVLEIRAVDGRRGGALLDGPVEARTAEVAAPLGDWADLGLRALGGEVRYRTTVTAPDARRVVLDLGAVRGTADVSVNGVLVDRLVWGPWRTEITGALRPGANDIDVVVRGTLAGYLDGASPTLAVAAGQVRTGLFGPVRLTLHDDPEA